MKITRRQLKQIIKEELARVLNEQGYSEAGRGGGPTAPITTDTAADPHGRGLFQDLAPGEAGIQIDPPRGAS